MGEKERGAAVRCGVDMDDGTTAMMRASQKGARVDLHVGRPRVEADVPAAAPLALLDGAREPHSARLGRNDGAEFEEERAVPCGAVLRGRSGEGENVISCRAELCRRNGATDAVARALHASLPRTLTGFMKLVAQ